ncbi:MAG: alpha/beta hydrolase [Bacilli bacterium]|nr:alpha/beta hydrolase [Bacilli bacterium]
MPLWLLIIIIVVSSLILIYVVFSFCILMHMGYLLTKQKYKTREFLIKTAHHEEWPGYFDLKKEPFELKLRDGYIINGDVSLNGDSKKFFILCHGHGSTREGSTKYGLMYFKLGYSIVRYDQRGHGDNVRCKCTMGANESKDLIEIINYVKNTYGQDIKISLHGASMGAATILIATRYLKKDDIKFIVADCPYSSVSNFGGDFIKMHHQPRFLLTPVFNFIMRVFFGIKKNDMSPEFHVKTCDIPILFLHGAKDDFILPYHSDRIFKAKIGEKEQHIFPNGTHANSVFDDPEEYERVVVDYVKRHE